MAILTLFEHLSPITIIVSTLTFSLLAIALHRAYLHPLRAVPGPFICRITSLWIYWHSYIGDECTRINALHATYGPVVRIAPNEVCLSDGAALAPIYSDKGGYLKAPSYRNFDFEGHATIFSAVDPAYRAVRSKAVLPLFSMSSVRNGNDAIESCVHRFVACLKEDAQSSRMAKKETGQPLPINILNLTRSLALDAISAYLFGCQFGGVDEKTDRMSATGYVDAVVAIGRLFPLPNRVFRALELAKQHLLPDKEADASAKRVDDFVAGPVLSSESPDTYQARLKRAGITQHEVKVQTEDVIFAGTDSTGMNLSSICWYLVKYPRIYAKLRQEIAKSDVQYPNRSPQGLPYLDAVVREGLRLAMANPIRLPRIVPPQGFEYTASDGKTYQFLAGTQVGVQIYTLHVNPEVFSEPLEFKPERWLEDPTPEMQRDWIPFGLGQRQCIARNLAMQELLLATRALAREDVLAGARTVSDRIEILEWFNSKVVGERIDLVWE